MRYLGSWEKVLFSRTNLILTTKRAFKIKIPFCGPKPNLFIDWKQMKNRHWAFYVKSDLVCSLFQTNA